MLVQTGLVGFGIVCVALVPLVGRARRRPGRLSQDIDRALVAMAVIGAFHDLLTVDIVLWWWASAIGLLEARAAHRITVAGHDGARRLVAGRVDPGSACSSFVVLWGVVQPAWARWLWRSEGPRSRLWCRGRHGPNRGLTRPSSGAQGSLCEQDPWTWEIGRRSHRAQRRGGPRSPGCGPSVVDPGNGPRAGRSGFRSVAGQRRRWHATAFSRAVELEPHQPWVWLEWARLERNLGLTEDAVESGPRRPSMKNRTRCGRGSSWRGSSWIAEKWQRRVRPSTAPVVPPRLTTRASISTPTSVSSWRARMAVPRARRGAPLRRSRSRRAVVGAAAAGVGSALGLMPAHRDLIDFFVPMRALTADLIGPVSVPWLNLANGCGEAWFANPETAVLYPPAWLHLILSEPWALTAEIGLHLALLSLGVGLVARESRSESTGSDAGRGCGLVGRPRAGHGRCPQQPRDPGLAAVDGSGRPPRGSEIVATPGRSHRPRLAGRRAAGVGDGRGAGHRCRSPTRSGAHRDRSRRGGCCCPAGAVSGVGGRG